MKERVFEQLAQMAGHFRGRLVGARDQTRAELGLVGDRVRSILTHSGAYVTALKEVLGEVTHGAAMEAISEPHRRQAEAIERYLEAFDEQEAATQELIRQALQRCDDIRLARAGIGQVAQLSNILRLSAKVETVYLGEDCREFETLAEEMKQLNLDVLDVSQGIDDLVIELRALVIDLEEQGRCMRERTTTFAGRFSDHLEHVRRETQGLQQAGVEAQATGDLRAEHIRKLAESALEQLGFTDTLDEQLDQLDGALGAVCDQLTSKLGCEPIPREVALTPAVAEATPEDEDAMDEGELLLF